MAKAGVPHQAGVVALLLVLSSAMTSAEAGRQLGRRDGAVLVTAAATATTACSQYLEVSSQVPMPPAVPYDRHQYANLHVPAAAAMAPEPPATNTGAFKRYARHLGPKRPPKPGACGQRMFKTAMSVLSKMHAAARYSAQQQYYYQQAAAAEAAAPALAVNQLQHMFSERKRREKLNDSFHALKAVLPPGAKVLHD